MKISFQRPTPPTEIPYLVTTRESVRVGFESRNPALSYPTSDLPKSAYTIPREPISQPYPNMQNSMSTLEVCLSVITGVLMMIILAGASYFAFKVRTQSMALHEAKEQSRAMGVELVKISTQKEALKAQISGMAHAAREAKYSHARQLERLAGTHHEALGRQDRSTETLVKHYQQELASSKEALAGVVLTLPRFLGSLNRSAPSSPNLTRPSLSYTFPTSSSSGVNARNPQLRAIPENSDDEDGTGGPNGSRTYTEPWTECRAEHESELI